MRSNKGSDYVNSINCGKDLGFFSYCVQKPLEDSLAGCGMI